MVSYREKNRKPTHKVSNDTSSSKVVQRARQTLGNTASNVPGDDLKNTVVEIRFLALSWLDDFEKKLFEGKTVNELLNQGGYD